MITDLKVAVTGSNYLSEEKLFAAYQKEADRSTDTVALRLKTRSSKLIQGKLDAALSYLRADNQGCEMHLFSD